MKLSPPSAPPRAGELSAPKAGSAQPARAGPSEHPAPAASGAGAAAPPPSSAVVEPGLPLPGALYELAPLGPGGIAAQPPAAPTLGAVFPQAGTPAFSIIAALFPAALGDGTLRRLVPRKAAPFSAEARYARIATGALEMSGDRSQGDPSDMRWTLPFFVEGKFHHARWRHGPGGDGPDAGGSQTYLETEFALTGRIRIIARLEGRELLIHVLSETPLPTQLLRELDALIRDLGTALGLEAGFSHAVTPPPGPAGSDQR